MSPDVDDARHSPVLFLPEAQFRQAYKVYNKLGEGSYAVVHRCVRRKEPVSAADADEEEVRRINGSDAAEEDEGGEEYAVKVIAKRKAGAAELESLVQEARILAALSRGDPAGPRRGVVGLHAQYQSAEHIYLVLDYVEGSTLFNRVTHASYFSEEIASGLVAKALSALAYVHSSGFMHRDLKPENLLMRYPATGAKGSDEYYRTMTDVVLADFGLATAPPSRACCGSPSYVAPEILRGLEYGTACDVWSLGVIVFILLAGEKPFTGRAQKETFTNIVTAPLAFASPIWEGISAEAKALLVLMLNKNPAARPTAAGLLEHPWIARRAGLATAHMEGTVDALKKLRVRERFATALHVFKIANVMAAAPRGAEDGGGIGGGGKGGHAWVKYVRPVGDTATVVTVQSQTHKEKIHSVNLERCLNPSTEFKLQDMCSCNSQQICRHVQYTYQYLFVGDWENDIVPHVQTLQRRRASIVDEQPTTTATTDLSSSAPLALLGVCAAGTAAAAAGLLAASTSRAAAAAAAATTAAWCAASGTQLLVRTQRALASREAAFAELARLDSLLFCMMNFKRLFDLTPETYMKGIVFGCQKAPCSSPEPWATTESPKHLPRHD
eukprot:Rhum_TRINITY_DN8028_c0_g1::Rhum_TRINITY_DN8028_c0_g1_i1::g.25857::m.25857/K04515/CAMK2; calcium/calmodulin-dependent protein kinase (CaM kinase) II